MFQKNKIIHGIMVYKLPGTGGCVNLFIYAIFNNQFQEAFKTLVYKKKPVIVNKFKSLSSDTTTILILSINFHTFQRFHTSHRTIVTNKFTAHAIGNRNKPTTHSTTEIMIRNI